MAPMALLKCVLLLGPRWCQESQSGAQPCYRLCVSPANRKVPEVESGGFESLTSAVQGLRDNVEIISTVQNSCK